MTCYKFEAVHYLRARHIGECDGTECAGCTPCTVGHCGCRGHLADGDQMCPKCVGKIRTDLEHIEQLMAVMPTEAVHRGVNSEAANLTGPAADPEAWSWRKVSAITMVERPDGTLAPRKDHVSLIEDDDPHHPKTVLGTWEAMIREANDHQPQPNWTLTRSINYLTWMLTDLARDPGQDVAQFGKEVRHCRQHLEQVLHDGEQRDTGAPCMQCEIPLAREWGKLAAADGWRCPKCREFRTNDEYLRNVAQLHRDNAKWLTDHDMEIRTGISAGTIRVWARRDYVGKRRDSGRVLYSVADVEARIAERAS